MKKVLVAFITVSAFASISSAADRLDGCGLGWQVTSKKTYTATTTRGTTNAFIPPTFGMTTGTMGCDKLDIGKNDKEAAEYVATNFDSLKSELASGRGEYVTALATAMGCKASADMIGTRLQKNYNTVVAPAANAVELYKGIKADVAGLCI
ncbi:DUF3015 family protein [Bdellovibrio sp. 22V]|uniref:DUF3015 family protein n=1 Tax=Bdellovibrio TaxID=958 RepID=UPI0025433ADA|nr:DUF3015 family protein [Bdellovibrio sp. 22V]WII73244.1 DUF3015 family protein [Bdellovibrio sp. 22V]